MPLKAYNDKGRTDNFTESLDSLKQMDGKKSEEYFIPPVTITVEEVGTGYRAYVTRIPSLWRSGNTKDWAIGKLMRYLSEHPGLLLD